MSGIYGRSVANGTAGPVDRAQWEGVLAEVGARALSRYTVSYLELLSERVAVLERAVAGGAGVEALRIMADLRMSSAMLGARRLAALVARAEAELRSPRVERRQSALRAVRGEARAVGSMLRSALAELSAEQQGGPGQPRADPPAPPNR